MVVLLIHIRAEAHREQGIKEQQQVNLQRRHCRVYDHFPEIADEHIHRVQQEKLLCGGRVSVHGVEDGGHIHQKLSEDAPEILNVAEEHEQRREYKSNTDIEADEQGDGIEEADKPPRECNAVDDAEDEEHAQRQAEVY